MSKVSDTSISSLNSAAINCLGMRVDGTRRPYHARWCADRQRCRSRFFAVVWAHTDARIEGYVRHEWKRAVDRTHDMADDAPFLLSTEYSASEILPSLRTALLLMQVQNLRKNRFRVERQRRETARPDTILRCIVPDERV